MKALFILTIGMISLGSFNAHAIDCDKNENGNELCLSIPDEAPQAAKIESSAVANDKIADKQMLGSEVSGGALSFENNLHLTNSSNSVYSSEIGLADASLSGLSDAIRAQNQLSQIDLILRSQNAPLLGNSVLTASRKH